MTNQNVLSNILLVPSSFPAVRSMYRLIFVVAIVVGSFFGAQIATVEAAPVITVNGSAERYNGSPGDVVTLVWHNDGGLDCAINGVPLPGSEGRSPGSRTVTVTNAQETFEYTCHSGRDSVSIGPDVSVCPWTGPNVYGVTNSTLRLRGPGGLPSTPAYHTYPTNNGSLALGSSISAGSYRVSVFTYDDDTGGDRAASWSGVQDMEQVVVEFIDAGGNVIAVTTPTPDLDDSIAAVGWSGVVNDPLNLMSTATRYRYKLSPAAIATWTPMIAGSDEESVEVGCFRVEPTTPPSVPSVTLVANPNPAPAPGSNVNLTYDLTNIPGSCTLTGGGVNVPGITADGTTVVNPATSTTYTISCGGGVDDTVLVIVLPVPSVVLTATPNPSTVPGGAVVLDYDLEGGAGNCTLSGGGVNQIGINSDGNRTVYPMVTTTYTILCDGGITDDEIVVVNPSAGGLTVTLVASDNPITSGNSTTLTWTVSDPAATCTPQWAASPTTGGGSASVSPVVTTPYTVECTNGADTGSANETVNVSPSGGGGLTVTLNASPNPITSGNSTTLTWTVSDPGATCTPQGGWASATTGGGSASVSPAVTTPYTVECTNGVDTGDATAPVNVSPRVNLGASPAVVNPGDQTTLSWSVSGNATNCTASGGWTGSKSTTGGTEAITINADTTFTLTCSNPAGSGSASASVTVNLVPVDLSSMTLSASPSIVRRNETTTLIWNMDSSAYDDLTVGQGGTCVITSASGFSYAVTSASGSVPSDAVSAERDYTFTCSSGITPANSTSVTVRVLPTVQES